MIVNLYWVAQLGELLAVCLNKKLQIWQVNGNGKPSAEFVLDLNIN